MVGSLIVSYLTATATTAFTIGMTIAAAAINFAVSFIVNRAFAPKLDDIQSLNNREQVPPTTDNSIPIVYGDAYLGGTFVDAALSSDQKTMYYVLAISSISPNGQFTYDTTKFYYGGRLITFSGTETDKVISLTDDAGNVDTAVTDNLWIYLYTSNAAGVITPVNTASMPHQVMSGSVLPAGLVWPSSGRQMNGVAFAIVRLVYHAQEGFTQLQPITFKVKQALSGVGVARPGDVWYDYMTSTIYGAAIDNAYIDSASVTALNTYSDQTITYTPSGGGTASQARYRINGVLSGNISCLENINKILDASDSWMTYNAASGQWALVVNKAEGSSYTFNDSNIVGEIRVSATDITQSINQIEVRFPFKENKDQPNFAILQTPDNLLYPNEPVNKASITYDLVNDSVQAQYLANRVLEQSREDLIVSFNTTYFGIQVDAGNVVSVTNSDFGWNNKLFRVMKVNETSLSDGQLGARLELTEYNSQVYDDFPISQFTPIGNGGNGNPASFGALTAPTVIASRPNAQIPSFDVRVTMPATGLVTEIALYYATVASPTESQWVLLATSIRTNGGAYAPSSTFDFFNLVLPTGTYYFGYTVGNTTGRSNVSPVSTAFAWSPVTTGSRNVYPTLYQWSATQPANPLGTSTFTWATGVLTYDNVDAWRVTAVNPGTPGLKLWEALKWLNDTTGAAVSTFSWTFGGTQVQAIGQNGSDGTVGPRSASGFIYYQLASQTAPSPPTASGFNFDTGAFSVLSANWSTTFNMPSTNVGNTNSNRFWAVRYNVSEATYGGLQTVTISSVFNWTNFDGLVTFSNLTSPSSTNPTGGITYIDGGHIITATLTVDRIQAGSSTTQNDMTFGFGSGSAVAGISTVGFFRTTRYDTMPLAALAANNVAFAASTVANDGSAYFGNRYGYGIDSIASGNNITLAATTNPSYAGYFQYRLQGGSASAFAPDANTRALGKIAFQEGSGLYYGAQFINYINGYYAVCASNTFALYTNGPIGPFTGSHDGLLDRTVFPEAGDILVDLEVIATKGVMDTITTVAVSSQENQRGVIGVFVGESDQLPVPLSMTIHVEVPGIDGPVLTTKQVLNPIYEPVLEQNRVILLNALGEGQMNVCGLGGDITKGDLIVTSSMAGKGMKQADDIVRSYTVAKARQNVTFASPTDVQLISVIYLSG